MELSQQDQNNKNKRNDTHDLDSSKIQVPDGILHVRLLVPPVEDEVQRQHSDHEDEYGHVRDQEGANVGGAGGGGRHGDTG